jgi:hypothetical protein
LEKNKLLNEIAGKICNYISAVGLAADIIEVWQSVSLKTK